MVLEENHAFYFSGIYNFYSGVMDRLSYPPSFLLFNDPLVQRPKKVLELLFWNKIGIQIEILLIERLNFIRLQNIFPYQNLLHFDKEKHFIV